MSSISHAPWLKSNETRAVVAALEAARAGSVRFVGGCVRNAVMGRDVDDIDIATPLTPDAVTKAAKAAGLSAVPTGVEHGTVTVIANHVPYEVTTLRRDVTTDGRRATVAFTESWEEDAQRRDFRLNALYATPDGAIHDPTGGGLDDARAGRVIFIGDAETRLREDYLRILRFFRFNAWYAKGPLDPHGLEACAKHLDGFDVLSAERVWKETKKLLNAPDPRASWEAMEAIGVRAKALPEITEHDRLVALLTIESDFMLDHDPLTRIAAGLAHENAARDLVRRMKASNEERERLVDAVGGDERIVSYLSMREVRRLLYRLGATTFEDRVRLAWAAEGSDRTATQWRALLAHARAWTPLKLPLTGDEVMAAGVPAGPKIGEVMREVESWWIDADFPDDKLSIVERLKAVAQALK